MNRFLRDFVSDGQKVPTRAFQVIHFELVKLAFDDLQLEQGSIQVLEKKNFSEKVIPINPKGRTRISTNDEKKRKNEC